MANYNGLLSAFSNPAMMNAAAALLEASGPSRIPVSTGQAIGRGLLAYQQGQQLESERRLREMQAKRMEDEAKDRERQRTFMEGIPKYWESAQQGLLGQFGGPTNEAAEALPSVAGVPDKFNRERMLKDMMAVPGLQGQALEQLLPKTTIQDGYAITVGPDGMPKASPIPGYQRTPKSELDLFFTNPDMFARYAEMKNRGGGGGGTPYYMPVQTGQGVMSFNARTGRMEPVAINGAPVVGSSSDPALQGEIAERKAKGKEVGKASGEATADLSNMEATLPRLYTVVSELSALGKKATYTMAGQGVDIARRQAGMKVGEGAIARKEYISKVDNEILPLLRQTFGAQFTQKEGESLKATLGDPNASPEEKDAVLQSFIETKKGQISSLRRRTSPGQTPTTGGWGAPPPGAVRRK